MSTSINLEVHLNSKRFGPTFPSITASALSRGTTPFASRERGQGRRRRSSQTRDAATGSPSSMRGEAQARELGFALSRICRKVKTEILV